MAEIPGYSNLKQLARVTGGMRGGPFFKNVITPAPMSFVEGNPQSVQDKLQASKPAQPTPIDSWFSKRK